MTTNELANRILIIGIPAALAMCAWGLTEIIHNGKSIERVVAVVEGMQRQINENHTRIERLEDDWIRRHP